MLSPCHVMCFETHRPEELSLTLTDAYQGPHPLIQVRSVIGLAHGGLGMLEFDVSWI